MDDAKNFQVSLDVPGFHFHEMKVELESGGRVLSIVGTKEESYYKSSKRSDGDDETVKEGKVDKEGVGEEEDKEGTFEVLSHSAASFQQKFTLDPSVDTSKMTANLVNGKLVVRAPRKYDDVWGKRHIPITQFDDDVWAELIESGDDRIDADDGDGVSTTKE